MPRISLPHNATCSEPSVFPKNWATKKASTKSNWYISYRYYWSGKVKLVIIKGMNHEKDLELRQEITRALIEHELYRLKSLGFNPITGKEDPVIAGQTDVTQETPFPEALDWAYRELKISPKTQEDIRYVVPKVIDSINRCHLSYLPIQDIRRKHVMALLKDMERNEQYWSNNKFNKVRSYLMMLFKELVKAEALEINPVSSIDKEFTVKRIRQTLSLEDRKILRDHIPEKYPEFWRFIQIFFHSGARISELMKIRFEDVDLPSQRFKVVISKGKQYRETWRPIKNISLPFWEDLMKGAQPADFLFSKNLAPGKDQIRPDQIGKRWYRLVKKRLGITADIYSMKHLQLTEVSEILGAQKAAELAGHTSTAMVRSIYDVNYRKRKDDEIRNIANEL